ncbi:MAG TPA: ABC transporter substrate-binding protein [Geminicoccaceae bacterium]|nr:ABC transporter substrate-binding protein [Geminicoccaceae bacterium]
MTRSRLLFGGFVFLAMYFFMPALRAETPPDTLVMANQIDDMITLDPAEVFEFTAAEYAANVYDRLVTYPVDNVEDLRGHVAESWEIADDGKTYTFKVRDGITFHSGNPLTAADAVFSLQRVIKLNKTPAFILNQFGFTPENVEQQIQMVDDRTFTVVLDQPYAPTFFLYCLTATVGSVVDKREVLAHEQDGDMGYEWLKTASAGSGPFKLRSWKPNESLIIERNDGYWLGEPGFARVITRHIAEPASQMLLLEKGDIDIARNLEADQIEALRGNSEVVIKEVPKGAIYYLGLNQKNEYLARPEVRQALKYLIPYDDIANTIVKGSATVHQAFLPQGFLGAIEDKPYTHDLAKAKELLKQAGLEGGFKVTMDTRNTSPVIDMAQVIQAAWAEAGIELEILPGDNKQTLTKYRARTHDIYIGRWGPDYQDPHTNADTFSSNPDNADGAPNAGKLAWRNAWDIPEMTAKTAAAVLEQDPARRAQLYEELQREHQQTSPFVIMFQDIEVIAERDNVEGMIWGPSFDDNKYWKGHKG